MIRFFWILITFISWGYVLVYLPRLPTLAILLMALTGLVGYIYGWTMKKRNHLIYFYTSALWLGVLAAYGVMRWWELEIIPSEDVLPFPVPVPVHVIGKVVLLVTFIFAGILTFANYRITLSFMQRRGNIEKDRLVKLYSDGGIIATIHKWLDARSKPKDIMLTLGEEIPFKDD